MRPSLVIENRVASSKLVRLWRCVSDRVQPSNTDIGGLLARWEWPLHNLALRDLEYHGLRSDASQQNLNPDWRIYLYYSLLIWPRRVFIFGHICMFWHILYSYNIYFFCPSHERCIYLIVFCTWIHASVTHMHAHVRKSIHSSFRTYIHACDHRCMCVMMADGNGTIKPHWRRRWRSSISLSQQVWGNPSESPKHTYKYKLAIIGANNQEAVCCTRMRKVMSDK